CLTPTPAPTSLQAEVIAFKGRIMLVQFSDAKKTRVIAYLAGPQDPDYFPHQGEIDTDNPKWAVFYEQIHLWGDGLPEPILPK
ncbi:hypothetical protein ABXK85_20740, partial [Yersinia enterocolitica]